MGTTTKSLRNIALIGHGSTGKTTLTEQILFNGGVISRAETVESGKTTSDYTEEEIERKISIHTSLSHCAWKDMKVNILDTPGSSDFIGEVVSAFRASEAAVMLIAGDAGVQIETIKIWRRLNRLNKPRIVFINKMDKERADFDKCMNDLKDKFDSTFVPFTIPIGAGSDFKGIINLLEKKAYMVSEDGKQGTPAEIPADMKTKADEYYSILVERAAEGDDSIIEKYLEQGTLSSEELVIGLTEGLKNNKIVPVLCGSALKNTGVVSLLDFIALAGPSPAGLIEEATDNNGTPVKVETKEDASFSAFVFKTSIDQFSGRLSFIKVMSGKVTADSEVYNVRESKKERVGKLYTTLGKKLEEMKEIVAGDIGIFTKLDSVRTNDTLCTADKQINFKPLELPQPVHSVTISATSKKEEDKLNQLLHKAAEEDPTFRIHFNAETRENVISGMGELHLGIILDKIKNNSKIDIQTKVPRIAYRETITKGSDAEYTHKKQTGGHGQYAKVVLQIKPLERGKQFNFVNAIHGGSIPKNYIPAVEKGVLEGMEQGILAGYPVVDLEATVVDGKEHPVDSSDMAFKLASRGALKDAMEKAKPVLLEPIMNLSVFVEEQYLGSVLSDLSSKRGKVQGQEPIGGGILEIKAQVPHAELLRYAIDLRSITSGTASFEMEFSHYEPIAGKIAEDVIKAAKQAAEAAAAEK